ncbi:hypothetical protein PAXRUDRAFT_162157, partial [Paxillus rubicundulus Ve08.2h10]
GVGVTLKHDDVWEQYLKWHPAARPFKNKGFKHFCTISDDAKDLERDLYLLTRACSGLVNLSGWKACSLPQSEPTLYFCQQ